MIDENIDEGARLDKRCHGEFVGKSLKLRCSFGNIKFGFCRNVSVRVAERAEMPFTMVNGKTHAQTFEGILPYKSPHNPRIEQD